jgi:hypothetical protein
MGLPDNRNDRDFAKYREPSGRPGETAVAVVGPDGGSIGGTGGTSMLDDAAFTPGGSSLTPAGFLADETGTDPVDEGDIGAARMNPTTRVQYVQLKDASGNDVAVGGGTQYTEGDTDASITGTAALWEDAGNTLRAVSAAKPLPVAQTGELPAGTQNIGDVDVASLPADPLGANADAIVAAGAAGSLSAKLRRVTQGLEDLKTLIVLAAGSARIGKVTIRNAADAADIDPLAEGTFTGRIGEAQASPTANTVLARLKTIGDLLAGTLTLGSHAVTNDGTFAVQESGAALTALQKIDDPVLVDDAGFTPGTSSVMMAGFAADETSTDSVDEGDAGAARMTLDRKQIVTLQPHTKGGLTPFNNLDVDETEDAIKASAGQLYELYLFNTTNAILYVKLYDDTVANVVVGTTAPVMTIPVPANNDLDGAGVVRNWPAGLAFANAITIAATTGVANNDTGAPAANALIASGGYA